MKEIRADTVGIFCFIYKVITDKFAPAQFRQKGERRCKRYYLLETKSQSKQT